MTMTGEGHALLVEVEPCDQMMLAVPRSDLERLRPRLAEIRNAAESGRRIDAVTQAMVRKSAVIVDTLIADRYELGYCGWEGEVEANQIDVDLAEFPCPKCGVTREVRL